MIELRLDLANVGAPGPGIVPSGLADRGITLTNLAAEYAREPEALSKLYSLALVVHDSPQWSLEEYLRRFERWEAVFIATTGEIYAGYSYLVESQDTPGLLKQCMTGVRPEFRRCGIASALKARAIEYARERGFSTIVTRVRPQNQASLAMNHKFGFWEQESLDENE